MWESCVVLRSYRLIHLSFRNEHKPVVQDHHSTGEQSPVFSPLLTSHFCRDVFTWMTLQIWTGAVEGSRALAEQCACTCRPKGLRKKHKTEGRLFDCFWYLSWCRCKCRFFLSFSLPSFLLSFFSFCELLSFLFPYRNIEPSYENICMCFVWFSSDLNTLKVEK